MTNYVNLRNEVVAVIDAIGRHIELAKRVAADPGVDSDGMRKAAACVEQLEIAKDDFKALAASVHSCETEAAS